MAGPGFYYGSYMDPEILRKYGAPSAADVPPKAMLSGWRLTFTPHANLVRDPGGMVEGVVHHLPQEELDRLYGPDGFVTTYRPVQVPTSAGPMVTFVERATEQPPDPEYVATLLAVMQNMGLSRPYRERVQREAQRLGEGA